MSELTVTPQQVGTKPEPDPWAPAEETNNKYPGPGKPPIVSIILPAYNAHNTIKKTIASIAMQEGSEDIEVIIADDCSKYDYNKIAEQFAHMIRIRVVKMLKNGGPGAARQVGFDHSYGQYIMWMDADDTLVAADTIKTLVNVMEQQHMDCVYGKFLEENENGSIYPHEVHMVWMFGKLYRRSFLERYNIRFNTSLSNEDTGFNCVVKGCTDKIWYIPKDVYIWHFKANSITRIKQGMYGQDSGYKGWSDNMVWQIIELQKRFVNRNYILSEIIGNMVTSYCFHEENLKNYPMNAEISLNWCRGFYHNVYEPNEKYISQALFDQLASQCLASHNISAKGIIPSMSLKQFMREMKKPVVHLPNEETCGATPAGYIPPITSEDWPVEITDFYDRMEAPIEVDSDTNHSRYGGMKKAIGVELSDEDYDMEYDGSQPITKKDETVMCPMCETVEDTTPAEYSEAVIATTRNGEEVVASTSGIYEDVKFNEGKVDIPTDLSGSNGAGEAVFQSAINDTGVHAKFNRPFNP